MARGWSFKQIKQLDRDFVRGGQRLPVSSSNVAWIEYYPDRETIRVGYLNGDVWDYSPFRPDKAMEFALAPSKGTWVWDNIKVRGTKDKHRCSAVKV